MKMGLRSINESLREAVDIPGSICPKCGETFELDEITAWHNRKFRGGKSETNIIQH